MSENKRWRRSIICAFTGMVFLGAGIFCNAADAQPEKEVVRVGIFSLGQFQYLEEDGSAGGYNGDYLDQIAQIAHWSYEFVPVENWVEATQLLEEGEIDLLAPAQKIESLEEKFAFASYEMGTEFGAVYTEADRSEVLYGDSEAMAGLTYGVAEGSSFAKQFTQTYCPSAGFVPKIVEYKNTTEQFDALWAGEVDAIVTNIMFAQDGLKILGRFTPMSVYYIMPKENVQLQRELDEAMTTLRFSNPTLSAELMSTYFPIIQDTQLTYDEQQFVQNMPEIRIGYQEDQSPLSYTDENGEFAGITRDILDRIAAVSGLKFSYVALPQQQEADSAWLQEQDLYIVSGVAYNDSNTGRTQIRLSAPYLDSEKVLVAKKGSQLNQTEEVSVAVASISETLPEAVQKEFPDYTIQSYPTTDACFDAVCSGETDALILNRYVAERELGKPAYADLQVLPMQGAQDDLCLCAVDAEDGTFISVVDKAIRQLTKAEINSIIITNTTSAGYRMTTGDFLWQYRYLLTAIGIPVLGCILLLIALTQMRERKNRSLAQKNQALADAVSMAERANTAKSQFLSRMSHEIRTPMNAIVGITTIAKAHKEDPEKMDNYLSKIEISSKVLLSIINDVLDMSAIESDKIKIASEEFDIKQLLNGITAVYYPQCRDKSIQLVVAVDLEEELLIGDSLRVNQILMNLVSNAYKFTEHGGKISILVSCLERREEQMFVRFVVADTGCGMSQEMMGRLFKPFEQENATTAKEHGGSGLGMSIAKNLVNLMHGAIKVESEKGKGSTFTVDLPFGVVNKKPQISEEKLSCMHALIVDDEETAREYTAIVLKRIGVQYEIASSGEQAVAMAEAAYQAKKNYDICFIDWKMPGLNGTETAKKIRNIYGKDTLIIIVSAYDLSEVQDEAKKAGADMFVSKPIFQSTIFNALMNLTGGKLVTTSTGAETYDFTGHKVLLAEDNALNAEIAEDLLDMVNLKLDHAENGKRAVEMFEDSQPGTYDAILMDVQMPIMDGYDATRAIRRLSRPDASNIPILAMTANAFTEDITAALSAGMNGHIAKPVDAGILYRTLAQTILEQR